MPFPKRPVRRAQLIAPFGVGAMINFPGDESLMPVVIDEWPEATAPCPPDSGWAIRDERLEARLGVTHFRFPPDFRDVETGSSAYSNQRVPMVRFPRWHYCHLCGGMEYVNLHEQKAPRCKGYAFAGGRSCKDIPEKRRPRLMPVRFVAVCEQGHLEDFPFLEWAHIAEGRQGVITPACQLRFRAGVSAASLAGVVIECVTCQRKKSMTNAFEFSNGSGPLARVDPPLHCQGGAPWQGVSLPPWRDGSHSDLLRAASARGAARWFQCVPAVYLQQPVSPGMGKEN